MNNSLESKNIASLFRLRPMKAAKVSEIAEATATSPVEPEERVNFHIGNPVQDKKLNALYRRLVFGIDATNALSADEELKLLVDDHGWKEVEVGLLQSAMRNAVPYTPRGGFHSSTPNVLATFAKDWASMGQADSLEYDLGVKTGIREIILSSGGMRENLRVFFYMLQNYLLHLPATILLFDLQLPEYLHQFPSLNIKQVYTEEDLLNGDYFQADSSDPIFLIMGTTLSENARRRLRRISFNAPLFFVEINNALNQYSMAREAGLLNNVIRFVSPGALRPEFENVALSFAMGNADYLKVFEMVHFELKGTPAATEIDLLTHLTALPKTEESRDNGDGSISEAESSVKTERIAIQIEDKIYTHSQRIEKLIDEKLSRMERASKISDRMFKRIEGLSNPLFGMSPHQVTGDFLANINDQNVHDNLLNAFLNVFLKHHPHYDANFCDVTSGSNRTALSLLGNHCGISDVIIPDLSWTYEHCFPNVTVVPLADDLSLDINTIISTVEQKLHNDPQWLNQGAVVLNNPHNASGQVYRESDLVQLLIWLLRHDVFVIDDLAYENVGPYRTLGNIKTLRQISYELLRTGQINNSQASRLISVHSLSKTDCFAGARLAVVEIPHAGLHKRYSEINSMILPNSMAILLSYLFYNNHNDSVESFWRMRNQILSDRLDSVCKALNELPVERNPFAIDIRKPMGSMYPHLVIDKLPHGISLDWLSAGLAAQGIGLIPLTTFARGEKGFDLARKTFRLSLGGTDGPDILYNKTRRMLIDLNRLIAEESAQYTRKTLPALHDSLQSSQSVINAVKEFDAIAEKISVFAGTCIRKLFSRDSKNYKDEDHAETFSKEYLVKRLKSIRQRYTDRLLLVERIQNGAGSYDKMRLIKILEKELYKESPEDRSKRFRQRLFDRTVHPTQMYSLTADLQAELLIESLLRGDKISGRSIRLMAGELVNEYIGTNVAIRSVDEADELVLDLKMMIKAEEWALWQHDTDLPVFLSFWGDWDGSTRPSGQGHRLVAAALLENVRQLTQFLLTLIHVDSTLEIDPALLSEIQQLEKRIQSFWKLLNEITSLTNQLEKRYQHLMPFDVSPGYFRKIGMLLKLAKDPLTALWQHNDRLERKMLKLRKQRRENLEYYFSLNKRLRKTLHGMLPNLNKNLSHPEVARVAGSYRDILKRFILTPRIHQKMILSADQFAIDTTVHNMMEINEISGAYGNPGMVLALQISMSTKSEALISLDRKMRTRREEILREKPESNVPSIWLVPLFEDEQTIQNLETFYNSLWEYAVQSRKLTQKPGERFSEMLCEVFFAGSDLSQQVSQTAGAALYEDARHRTVKWLAERGLVGKVRIKLGSGEPMQRQGGFYDTYSGKPLLDNEALPKKELSRLLKESAFRSLHFATSPLRGIFSGGEFRTFQSNIAEHMRRLNIKDLTDLIFHTSELQDFHKNELIRASEPLINTRLQFQRRGWKELQRLTLGSVDELFQEFTRLVTHNFQQIIYGREEDVIGIHVISYFISRTIPTFRDRPTVRPSRAASQERGQQIVEQLAQTLPLCKHGSLLRAIGHNRAQTVILGVNQLTTGLFRAFSEFAGSLANGHGVVCDRILPKLPVHDILHTLRIFHDTDLTYMKTVENAFTASNSALLALREDNDSIQQYISALQKELLKRQGLDASEFFNGERVVPELLPVIRPDVAVLLQPDLFNTDIRQVFHSNANSGWISEMQSLLAIPDKIRAWRDEIWRLIRAPIYQQVESFNELAMAIHTLAGNRGSAETPLTLNTSEILRIGTEISNLLKGEADDSMRQFLTTAVKYLTQIPGQMTEVPIDVIRALRDVENILRIDEQALKKNEQDMLRFYILNIARLCGENG